MSRANFTGGAHRRCLLSPSSRPRSGDCRLASARLLRQKRWCACVMSCPVAHAAHALIWIRGPKAVASCSMLDRIRGSLKSPACSISSDRGCSAPAMAPEVSRGGWRANSSPSAPAPSAPTCAPSRARSSICAAGSSIAPNRTATAQSLLAVGFGLALLGGFCFC